MVPSMVFSTETPATDFMATESTDSMDLTDFTVPTVFIDHWVSTVTTDFMVSTVLMVFTDQSAFMVVMESTDLSVFMVDMDSMVLMLVTASVSDMEDMVDMVLDLGTEFSDTEDITKVDSSTEVTKDLVVIMDSAATITVTVSPMADPFSSNGMEYLFSLFKE